MAEKQTRIFHMQPGANYYEAVTIYNSVEGVINLGEAVKRNANSNSNLNENANSNYGAFARSIVYAPVVLSKVYLLSVHDCCY